MSAPNKEQEYDEVLAHLENILLNIIWTKAKEGNVQEAVSTLINGEEGHRLLC